MKGRHRLIAFFVWAAERFVRGLNIVLGVVLGGTILVGTTTAAIQGGFAGVAFMGGLVLVNVVLLPIGAYLLVGRQATSKPQRGTRTSRRGSSTWPETGSARLLAILVRLLPGPLRQLKLEEWCADLTAIESGWERRIYLLDLTFDLPRLAWVARKAAGEELR